MNRARAAWLGGGRRGTHLGVGGWGLAPGELGGHNHLSDFPWPGSGVSPPGVPGGLIRAISGQEGTAVGENTFWRGVMLRMVWETSGRTAETSVCTGGQCGRSSHGWPRSSAGGRTWGTFTCPGPAHRHSINIGFHHTNSRDCFVLKLQIGFMNKQPSGTVFLNKESRLLRTAAPATRETHRDQL